MATDDKTPDIYEIKLQEQLEVVQQCQKEHKIPSCMQCKEVIGCEIRKSYVNAVYQSMSKGEGGGFEF
ncbi:MAG: hypothetical protein K0U47_00840 [Epsilonproteobacteria bacterium]|nr:hypothetical protein [Campylobacterota bacterium]